MARGTKCDPFIGAVGASCLRSSLVPLIRCCGTPRSTSVIATVQCRIQQVETGANVLVTPSIDPILSTVESEEGSLKS